MLKGSLHASALAAILAICLGAAGARAAEYPDSCAGPGEPSASSCPEGLIFEGCCDAKGRIVWCEAGLLYCSDCAAEAFPARECGWLLYDNRGRPANYYACGGKGEDPTGAHARECVVPPPDLGPEPLPEPLPEPAPDIVEP